MVWAEQRLSKSQVNDAFKSSQGRVDYSDSLLSCKHISWSSAWHTALITQRMIASVCHKKSDHGGVSALRRVVVCLAQPT